MTASVVPPVVAAPARVQMTGLLVAGRAIAAALSFAFMTVVARELDQQQVGVLSLGLTLAVALSVLPDLGLPMIVADRSSAHPLETRALVRRVTVLRLAASGLTAVVLLAMYRAASDGPLAVPALMAVSIASTAVHSTCTAALRGHGTVVPDVVNEVLSRALVLGAGAWLLRSGGGIVAAAAVLALADLVSALVLWRVVRARAVGSAPVPAGLLDRRAILPLVVALLVGSLHTRIDVWLVALLADGAEVAHYALPARVAEGLLLPAGVAAALVLPLTGRIEDPARRARQGLRYVAAITGVVAVAAAVTFAFAGPLLRLAFGAEYAADADVLRLLCAAAVPGALSVGLAPLVAMLARRELLRWMATALVVNVVANVALVPRSGAVGAAWASVLSVTVVAIGLAGALRSAAHEGAVAS